MDLADVMDDVADELENIAGLRVFAYPPGSLTPPAAVVTYPDSITFDQTYGRGMDRMSLPVVVVVGKATDRTARNRLGAYCDGAGASSIKAKLEAGTYVAFDTLRVTGITFDVVSIGGTEYLAALFDLDISGTGS